MIVRELLTRFGFDVQTGQLDNVDRKVAKTKGGLAELGNQAGLAATAIGAIGLHKGVQELQASVDASVGFGRQMANVSALIGGNQERTRELAAAAAELGKQYGVLPTEIAAAQYAVIGSLGDTADAVKQTETALKLGKAGAASTAEGFALLSAVTKAYGDTSGGAMTKVGDLAAAAVRLGSLTMPELASSIQSVTPMASALGVSLEELFNVQASLSGVTGNANEVYTQMGSAMTALIKKTPEMTKAFKKAFGKEGIKTAAEAVGKYGMQGALQKLVATTDGTQEQLVDLFGRIEGVRFALAVTGKQSADYTDKMGQMRNVTGEMNTAVKAQTTGMGATGFAIDKTAAAAEAQRIELGEKLAPAWVTLGKLSNDVAKIFGDVVTPAIGNMSTLSVGLGDDLDVVNLVFKGIRAVALGIVQAIDTMIFGIKELALTAMVSYYKVKSLLPGATGKEASGKVSELRGDIQTVGDEFMARSTARGALISGNKTAADIAKMNEETAALRVQAAADRAARRSAAFSGAAQAASAWGSQRASGGVLGALIGNVGGVQVNVTVPVGTEASAAARIGDTGARALLSSFVDQAARVFPLQTAKAQ